jgi:hypothetical protein
MRLAFWRGTIVLGCNGISTKEEVVLLWQGNSYAIVALVFEQKARRAKQ